MVWFTRLRNWQADAALGIGIRADYHDSEDDNFATGMNLALNVAGGNSPTANIPWGGFKITGAAVGTATGDYATVGQVQARTVAYAADSVGTDSYAITLSPAITAYAVGQQFLFAPGTVNTGAATLAVNGLAAKTIKKDKNTDLVDGDLQANQLVLVAYDGTNFQMLSPVTGFINQSGSAIYAADGGGSDTYAITLSPAPAAYATGMMLNFKANTANTGAATINVNGLGAKSIVKDLNLALNDNDIKATQIVQVIYDGTNFQLLSPTSSLVSQDGHAIYAADAQASDTYVITLSPAPTAYVTGMMINFKANTLNTGAATLNCNGLGAKSIVKNTSQALDNGDILANQISSVIYDGTNFQLLSGVSGSVNQVGSSVYAADSVGSDSYAITLAPAIAAYVTGMTFRVKCGTANTGGATLAVNGLSAITIVKNFNSALATGDIRANQIIEVVYDGTNFQMLSPAAAGGTFVLLQTNTSSTSAISEFNGLFSSSYDVYVFQFEHLIPATDNVKLYSQLGTGGTPTYTTTNYAFQTGATAQGVTYIGNVGSTANQITMTCENGSYGVSNLAGSGVCGHLHLYGTNGSSVLHMGTSLLAHSTATDSTGIAIVTGSSKHAADTWTAIKFYFSSGNISTGKIYMYGIKNS